MRSRIPLRSGWCGLLAVIFLALPARASATTFADLSLRELIERSDLIVAGRVVAIDDTAGMATGEALTAISLSVDLVLRGAAVSEGESFEIVHRGGLRPDGLIEEWSSPPELIEGDRYIVFLTSDFWVDPFIPAANAVLRLVESRGEAVVVDRGGHLVGASMTAGLMKGTRVADSLAQRLDKFRKDKSALAETMDMAMSSMARASEVIALIERVAKSTRAPRGHMKSKQRPKKLSGDAQQSERSHD